MAIRRVSTLVGVQQGRLGHGPRLTMAIRERGWVVRFNAAKGHGRIKADVDGAIIFVLFAAIRGEGFRWLEKGQCVEFSRQLQPGPHQWHADDVVVVVDAQTDEGL